MERSVYIFGMGPVGCSLAVSLESAGVEVAGACDIDEDRAARAVSRTGLAVDRAFDPRAAGRAGIVIASVGDSGIEPLAREAAQAGGCSPRQVWLHCSGALAADALSPLEGLVEGFGAFHPAMVFPPGSCRPVPAGTRFALDGDGSARAVANSLVEAIGGVPVEIPTEARVAYHAAMVFASNYVVVLLDRARGLLVDRGVDPAQAEAVVCSLASSAVDAAMERGIGSSLSGPVSRGDAPAVESHLGALGGDLDMSRLYAILAREAVGVATGVDGPNREGLQKILSLLDGFDRSGK